MSQNTPAQSGRARALAHRKAQLAGTVAKPSPVPAAASTPVVTEVSVPSRPRSAVVSGVVTVAAGRAAAKQKRQAQIKGQTSNGSSKASVPTRVRRKPVEPIVEPRQASASVAPGASSSVSVDRKKPVKSDAIAQSSGRLQSKAYRQAQAKGKASQDAYKSRGGSNAGAKAKIANPDASSRDIARQIRTERCTKGQSCAPSMSATKLRQERLKQQGSEAPGKVQLSETLSGQVVSGVHVGQGNNRMTGAETGACQLVSGVEYLGAEEFVSQCDATPPARPAKVTQTQTTRGMTISGSEMGQSGSMTGSETGACKSVTGTEYIPADQMESMCGTVAKGTTAKRAFSVMSPASRSAEADRVTGGDHYRSQSTTIRPADNQAKQPMVAMAMAVKKGGASLDQAITGDNSANATGMTGAEQGQCQAVTGTPYMKTEPSVACSADQQSLMQQRLVKTDRNPSVSGIQPGAMGLTGAQKGACELVTGTPYQGSDQAAILCGSGGHVGNSASLGQSDFPQPMAQTGVNLAPTVNVEVATHPASRITGDAWDRGDKVTGTEGPWASSRNASIRGGGMQNPMGAHMFKHTEANVPMNPITGSSGNTDTGAKVTLSGGARA